MSIFTISDLHLSTLDKTNKSMEVFGHRWADYTNRLLQNWTRLIKDEDTVIIPGDISWALSLEEALSDLKFIDALPGKKIFGKGNHDFWWCTMKKHREFFDMHGISTISFLFNNAYEVENLIVAGTRGWYHDEEAQSTANPADFEKLTNRESLRLKTSLDAALQIKKAAPEKEIAVFMHFPPFWNGKESENIVNVLKSYEIKKVYYGHIHGNYTVPASFMHQDIEMSLVSADYLQFVPKIVK